jgi:hypothetical protein
LVKSFLSLVIAYLLVVNTAAAQSPPSSSGAANPVQVSPAESTAAPQPRIREFKIPAGTPLEIETAYTVDSQHVRTEDLISFRVLVPIKIEGFTVIDRYSLVTGRVIQAKRGGHWGKAGKLTWIMQDVVAVDLTRVPLQAVRDQPVATKGVKGTSHGGQVATEMIVFGSLMMFAAPLVLMSGFRRGENAVLPEGKRFVVFVKTDTIVRLPESTQP